MTSTSASKRTYIVSEGWLGGWNVVCMNGPDPLYVIDTCETESEARALAAEYNTLTAH